MEMQPYFKKCIGLIFMLLSLCYLVSVAAAGQKGMEERTLTYRKIVDLSHQISPEIPLWPGDPEVEFETVATFEIDGYYLRRFSMGEHSGTHMNAPNSFHAQGDSIDTYPPKDLVRSAVVIDIRRQCAQNPDYAAKIQDVKTWEKRHGLIEVGSIVIFYTGWQEYWNSPEDFFNVDAQGGLHFPGVGGQTTRFLLKQRKIAGVGIDTHGVDPGQDEQYATNTQVLAQKGIILECLTHLDKLPPKGATLAIGLLRLREGSGSPVSVLAFVP
jgi:kynurenine formamidase